MKANFTVTNATFRDYLSNLSNPNTINLTNGICQAVSDKIIILQPLYQTPNTSRSTTLFRLAGILSILEYRQGLKTGSGIPKNLRRPSLVISSKNFYKISKNFRSPLLV